MRVALSAGKLPHFPAGFHPHAPMKDHPAQTNSELESVLIPYLADSELYFRAFAKLQNPIWLDSGIDRALANGRYDLISANPITTLETVGSTTTIVDTRAKTTKCSNENPFDLVEGEVSALGQYSSNSLPFSGGAMGYFGYHLNEHLEQLPPRPKGSAGLPDMAIGIYDWALIQDHQEQQSSIVFLPSISPTIKQKVLGLAGTIEPLNTTNKTFKINKLESFYNLDSYSDKVVSILDYLLQGDAYQVNFAQQFKTFYDGDPLDAYCALRQTLPATFSAYCRFRDNHVLSFSPELFLDVSNRKVVTRPIKGTMPRGASATEDESLKSRLLSSNKDKAENLMIVDLLRNDLGKHCKPGSIKVPQLFELESFANVHHLVSTVTGELKDTSSTTDLLKGCFPGGSITGAPKIRAMEIISELEEAERSVYCGSIGYLGTDGSLKTNIAIRTLVANQSRELFAWAGGGIVADSKPDTEYQECFDKIGVLLRALSEP